MLLKKRKKNNRIENPFIPYPKAKGIYALYLRYCYELRIIQKHPASVKRMPFSMRQDLILLDKLDAQTRFLAKHKYGTAAELESHKEKSTGRISELEQERNALRSQLRAATRKEDAPAVESLKSRIKEVSSEIKTLRQEVKLCDGIEARSALMERNLEQLRQERVANPDIRQLLNAMVCYAPCKVDFRDELPDGQSALYSPQEKTVFVLRGQSMEDVFRGVAQELAHAYLDTGNYSREDNTFLAQCVGNILCQRNGIDGKSLAVAQLPKEYAEMEPKQLREELKAIRTAANQISADMFRFLDAKSHGSRQRDDAR